MTVTVYSTPSCPWCKKTKEYLKSHNVKFKEIDVSTDTKAARIMIEKSGQQGVPVIDANGTIITGFDEEKLKSTLKIK